MDGWRIGGLWNVTVEDGTALQWWFCVFKRWMRADRFIIL